MSRPTAVAEIDADAALLAAIHRQVSGLNPGALARAEHAARLDAEVVAPLRVALADAIAALSRLEAACDAGDPETGEWGDHLEHTDVDGLPAVASALSDELWQQVGNLAFAGRSELRRVERLLNASGVAQAERVVGCEAARRKLRRAIHAVLEVAGQALGHGFDIAHGDGEVEAALAVRRMYAKFRRSLPPCDAADPAQVRRALRYAAVSLAVMVGSADFSEIRVPDRQLLLGLQARILAWARERGSDAAGAQLYLDLQTAADLLRSINLRQELVAHDRALVEGLAAAVAAARSDGDVVAAARPALTALLGKDDALDQIALSATDGAAASEVAPQLRAWLAGQGADSSAVEAA